MDEIRAVYTTVARSYDDLIPDPRFEDVVLRDSRSDPPPHRRGSGPGDGGATPAQPTATADAFLVATRT